MTGLTVLPTNQTTAPSDQQSLPTQPTEAGSQITPSEILPPDVSDRCEKCVDDYRKGLYEKADTFIKLQAIISRYVPDDQEDFAIQALRSYLSMLDNHDNLRNAAVGRSRQSLESHIPRGHPADRDDIESVGAPEERISQLVRKAASKRSRTPDESIDGSISPSYKRRIDPDKFAWVIQEQINPPSLSSELRQTQLALANFARDPKLAKSSLLNASYLPQFPDGEWTNILSGRFVDLDHVLSGIYAVGPDERRKEKLGALEITVGSCAPAKTVRSHSDWTITWESYLDAAVFVFPNRQIELNGYGKFVRQLFTSFPSDKHLRVIHYDKAVRLRVSQRRDVLLSEHAQFTDLSLLWLQNGGGSSAPATGEGRGHRISTASSSRIRREACRRFNAGTCPNSQASCDYIHVCSKCRATGHVASSCSSK